MANRMMPPGMGSPATAEMPKQRMPPPGEMDKPSAGKASPESAGVIRADAHCIDCVNYEPTSGDCEKVAGSFDPQDACSRYFSAIGSDEPDADDMGGESDDDADDAETMQ